MNQILSVERQGPKRKSSIHSIIIVFSIILMVFGIGLTTTGGYAYYKSISNNQNNLNIETNKKPMITIERESAAIINIVVTHDKELSKVTYTLNNGEPVQISGNNQKEITEKIELPVGSSNISITAEDINGISSSYTTSFEVEQKPTITLEQVENQIQITTESQINIEYIMYYWDDDQENATTYPINAVKNVTLVDVIEGTHVLTVKAVDVEGNEATKTQKIIGDNKPEIQVTTDGKMFIIKATDDESLAKIEITLNENETITENITGTEYNTTIELEDGENKLTVKIYNANGLSSISRVKSTKEQ